MLVLLNVTKEPKVTTLMFQIAIVKNHPSGEPAKDLISLLTEQVGNDS